jgi:hypothetical protein
VEFPEGSWLKRAPDHSYFVMRNTLENHRRFYEALTRSGVAAGTVLLHTRMLRFAEKELDPLEREKGRALHPEELLDLWRGGTGATVFVQGVRTVNGINSIVEVKTPGVDGKKSRGMLLNLTPTLSASEQLIHLVVIAESSGDPDWSTTTSVGLSVGESGLVGTTTGPDGVFRYVLLVRADLESFAVPWEEEGK